MALPSLNKSDVKNIIEKASEIKDPIAGGQKLVFPVKIKGKWFAAKFMRTSLSLREPDKEDQSLEVIDEITARARREVATMKMCKSPFLVKLGGIPLTHIDYKGQSLIYFTEEYIEGRDLKSILSSKQVIAIPEIIKMGRNITQAVSVIWSFAKIHRDIKPGNIMHRDKNGEYILLDMGLVFDIHDESLTLTGYVPGTPIYFSPEQIDLAKKRNMDFRSDLFSLGIVLYEAATGEHPFLASTQTTTDVIANIQSANPRPPKAIRSDIPDDLNEIILRLLAKKPHLRYRTCKHLDQALASI